MLHPEWLCCADATKFPCMHIVMAVRDRASGTWGALGLSRDAGLMWKHVAFPAFSFLLTDYKAAYAKISHCVLKFRIGLPVPHNEKMGGQVVWRAMKLRTDSSSWDELCSAADEHAAAMDAQAGVAYDCSLAA